MKKEAQGAPDNLTSALPTKKCLRGDSRRETLQLHHRRLESARAWRVAQQALTNRTMEMIISPPPVMRRGRVEGRVLPLFTG